MPPLTRNKGDRALQVMVANPAMRSHAVATGQQIGTAGTIPGTSSNPTQLATLSGTIQQTPSGTTLAASSAKGDTTISTSTWIPSGSYVVVDQNTGSSTQETAMTSGVSGAGPYTISLTSPLGYPHASGAPVQAPTTSPNGDQIAGVGHQVLNSAGKPVVVMGNLNAVSGGGSSKLPSSFQDGGFSFVDAQGNQVAGYSQETGLYGFGGVKVTDGTTTVSPASELDFITGATVTDGGNGTAEITLSPQYLWGVTSIYEGFYILLPYGAPYPSDYFPAGIAYNDNPGIDHNVFGGAPAGTVLLVPDPPNYTNTNPICLVYGGPTNPSEISPNCQLQLRVFTVGSSGYTVVGSGLARPAGWTYSPHGNIGPYSGLWMTYDDIDSISQLSWTWDTPLTGPISYNSDGSFTVTETVMMNMCAIWYGYMS